MAKEGRKGGGWRQKKNIRNQGILERERIVNKLVGKVFYIDGIIMEGVVTKLID